MIGICEGGANSTLAHELAHALFFTDSTYREAALAAMREYDTSAIERKLAEAGYGKHVISDEVQAYLVGPSSKLSPASRRLAPLRRKLRALFRRHSKGLAVPGLR